MSCIKYSFFFFNFLFWVLGALALGVGIWAATDASFGTKVEDALSSVHELDVSMVKQVINSNHINSRMSFEIDEKS